MSARIALERRQKEETERKLEENRLMNLEKVHVEQTGMIKMEMYTNCYHRVETSLPGLFPAWTVHHIWLLPKLSVISCFMMRQLYIING